MEEGSGKPNCPTGYQVGPIPSWSPIDSKSSPAIVIRTWVGPAWIVTNCPAPGAGEHDAAGSPPVVVADAVVQHPLHRAGAVVSDPVGPAYSCRLRHSRVAHRRPEVRRVVAAAAAVRIRGDVVGGFDHPLDRRRHSLRYGRLRWPPTGWVEDGCGRALNEPRRHGRRRAGPEGGPSGQDREVRAFAGERRLLEHGVRGGGDPAPRSRTPAPATVRTSRP